MSGEHKIDYLQYSTNEMSVSYGEPIEVERSPNKFYKYCTVYEGGVRVLVGNPNSDKSLVVMSGKACDKFRNSIVDIISKEIEGGAKFSRIDLCVTSEDGTLLSKFNECLVAGDVVSRRYDPRTSKRIVDINNRVETTYVGSMKKRGRNGIFRAYNKGLEMGLGFDLSRFELECKGDIAHNNTKRIRDGVGIGNMIRKAVDLPKEVWWTDLMGESKPLPKYVQDSIKDEDDPDRVWKWLCKQVAPALGKELAIDEKTGVSKANFDRFNEMVEKSYRRELK